MVMKSAQSKKGSKSQKCPKVLKVLKSAGPVNYNYLIVCNISERRMQIGFIRSFVGDRCDGVGVANSHQNSLVPIHRR